MFSPSVLFTYSQPQPPGTPWLEAVVLKGRARKPASGLLAFEAQIWAGWAASSYSSLEDFSSLPWPSLLPAAKWTRIAKPQDLLYLQDLV